MHCSSQAYTKNGLSQNFLYNDAAGKLSAQEINSCDAGEHPEGKRLDGPGN
jgi:hypothetical protein